MIQPPAGSCRPYRRLFSQMNPDDRPFDMGRLKKSGIRSAFPIEYLRKEVST